MTEAPLGEDRRQRAPRGTVLVVDDESSVRASVRTILEGSHEVLEAADATEALDLLRAHDVDLVMLDQRMPGESGLELLPRLKAIDASVVVVLVTAVHEVRTAVEALKGGAYDYLTKPFDVDDIMRTARRALDKRAVERVAPRLRPDLDSGGDEGSAFRPLVGRHRSMVRIYQLIAQVAQTPTTSVLIMGESGTGKELVARYIHQQSPRRAQPFVAVNVAAIPDTLLESELFGHEKGAFTGAYARKIGKFELGQGGTVFLDEIGSLRLDLQAKLLRVLQEREVERVGGLHPTPVDVRVLAATNVNLRQAIRDRTFREDLYYRLNVVPIEVPPLRERREDIPVLVEHFIRKISRECKRDVRGISVGARDLLLHHDWPGNVRELENVIHRAVVLARGPVLQLGDFPLEVALAETPSAGGADPGLPLAEARERFERQHVLHTLETVGWNVSRAARVLGVHRNTIIARLSAWGVQRPGSDTRLA